MVVFTDYYNKAKLIKFDNFCRYKGNGFIYAGNLGLYGFTFVDFGENFRCFDMDGEEPKNAIVMGIT
jgi:ubiquitin-activating enzyme E1